jgi:hypothetical protein
MKKVLFLLLAIGFISMHSCKNKLSEESTDVSIYDESILSIIDINSKIELLADSISLPEGPFWDEK